MAFLHTSYAPSSNPPPATTNIYASVSHFQKLSQYYLMETNRCLSVFKPFDACLTNGIPLLCRRLTSWEKIHIYLSLITFSAPSVAVEEIQPFGRSFHLLHCLHFPALYFLGWLVAKEKREASAASFSSTGKKFMNHEGCYFLITYKKY